MVGFTYIQLKQKIGASKDSKTFRLTAPTSIMSITCNKGIVNTPTILYVKRIKLFIYLVFNFKNCYNNDESEKL